MPVPFFIYVDFEAITEKIQTGTPEQDQPYGYSYKVVRCYDDGKFKKPVPIYRGGKAVCKVMEKWLKNEKN